MISRSKILGSALVGASLFAFTLPAGAQAGPGEIPASCLGSDGTVQVTDMNAAECSKYDTTSSIVPPDSVIHDDSSGTSGSDGGPAFDSNGGGATPNPN